MERKLGAILPRELLRGREILDFVKEVEKIGYDYVVACDHVVLPNQNSGDEKLKYSLEERYTDPLTLLSAIAAITNNLQLFTGVLILPERPTTLVARQAADVDILSNGRLNLGVGVGWLKEEFDALGSGSVFIHRGVRIEEQILLLRQLWTQEVVTFHGEHEQLSSVGINPRPKQQPIPVWIGGTDRRVIDRAVRMADGWMPRGKADEFQNSHRHILEDSLEKHQRMSTTLPVMGKVNIRWEVQENNWQKEGDSWLNIPPVSHLSVGSIGGKDSSPDDHLEVLLRARSYFRN